MAFITVVLFDKGFLTLPAVKQQFSLVQQKFQQLQNAGVFPLVVSPYGVSHPPEANQQDSPTILQVFMDGRRMIDEQAIKNVLFNQAGLSSTENMLQKIICVRITTQEEYRYTLEKDLSCQVMYANVDLLDKAGEHFWRILGRLFRKEMPKKNNGNFRKDLIVSPLIHKTKFISVDRFSGNLRKFLYLLSIICFAILGGGGTALPLFLLHVDWPVLLIGTVIFFTVVLGGTIGWKIASCCINTSVEKTEGLQDMEAALPPSPGFTYDQLVAACTQENGEDDVSPQSNFTVLGEDLPVDQVTSSNASGPS